MEFIFLTVNFLILMPHVVPFVFAHDVNDFEDLVEESMIPYFSNSLVRKLSIPPVSGLLQTVSIPPVSIQTVNTTADELLRAGFTSVAGRQTRIMLSATRFLCTTL